MPLSSRQNIIGLSIFHYNPFTSIIHRIFGVSSWPRLFHYCQDFMILTFNTVSTRKNDIIQTHPLERKKIQKILLN